MAFPNQIFAKWVSQIRDRRPRTTGTSPPEPPQTPESYVADRQKPVTPIVGDRLYALFDPLTGQATSTTNKTNYPLYFDPLKKELTPNKTAIPALYGMVGAERLNFPFPGTIGVPEAIKKDQDDLERLREMQRFDPGRYHLRSPRTAEDAVVVADAVR